jgi:hypothetical protein
MTVINPYPDGTREAIEHAVSGRHPGTVHLARYFAYAHLPTHLRGFSQPFAQIALVMIRDLPDGPELTAGLRKLLEAKDCFVRAALDRG